MMKDDHTMDFMKDGELYDPMDPAVLALQARSLDLMYEFNHTRPSERERRDALMRRMLAEAGENCYIEAPFYANWGGAHVHFGKGVYVNFHMTAVDDTDIYVGDYTMFGPNVTLVTAAHPVDPGQRGPVPLQYNLPVRIGSNCWIGAGVTILPGVTVGDNSVIGAGSLVTGDIPANVLAFGSPCRVVRRIGEEERETILRNESTKVQSEEF